MFVFLEGTDVYNKALHEIRKILLEKLFILEFFPIEWLRDPYIDLLANCIRMSGAGYYLIVPIFI